MLFLNLEKLTWTVLRHRYCTPSTLFVFVIYVSISISIELPVAACLLALCVKYMKTNLFSKYPGQPLAEWTTVMPCFLLFPRNYLPPTITSELSCTSPDQDQKAGPHYTSFKVAALAHCAL